jgi:hypothetical protein
LFLLLDADDGAGQRAGLSRGLLLSYLDFFTAGLIEDLAIGGIIGQIDSEALERFVDGIVTLIADCGNVPTAHVLQDHALE